METTVDFLVENFPTYWHVWSVGVVLIIISIIFFARFVLPSFRLRATINRATKGLAEIKERVNGNVVELSEIEDGPMNSPTLLHSWREYTETLHPQREFDASGQSKIFRWRATALAETYFTEQALVDYPLKADFYKHLPGILTGLGIIGTFLGLIQGLSSFDVSNPAQAQTELKNLINAVGHAFYVSGTAIALAMFFTWIEKTIVTKCSRQVVDLRQLIDSLFDAGAGEEYLERLVHASETQATQAAHIKDALIADLREILVTLTERQLEEQSRQAAQVLQAQAEHSGKMSVDVGKAIAEQLGGPIKDIAHAVKGVSTNQGDAINKMLTDVLVGFSAQVQDMFGDQMRGMTDLLKETSQAMKSSAEKFALLASDMDKAGKGAAEAMSERLNQAVDAMEARQQAMNTKMGSFVMQMHKFVAESQNASTLKLQEALDQVSSQVSEVVAGLRQQAEETAKSQGMRQRQFEESTEKVIASLSTQIENLLAQSVETNRSLQNSISQLTSATNDAISGLNGGAETLSLAASDFATAGQGVAQTMKASSEATGNINSASQTLLEATSAAQHMISDYSRTRDTFATMVSELKAVTENARKDATLTSEIISRIEASAKKLSEAQLQSEQYLEGINAVLVKSHESFSENVIKTLRESNRQFQDELRTAVDMVSAAVRDLGDTIEDITVRGL